jgi:hypothetical protein
MARQFCQAQVASLAVSPNLLAECAGSAFCVDNVGRRLTQTITGTVRVITRVTLTALTPSLVPSAQQEAVQLGKNLANPTQAANIINPYVSGTAVVAQVDVNGNAVPSPTPLSPPSPSPSPPSPTPSPSPSPPPPSPSPSPPNRSPPPPPPRSPSPSPKRPPPLAPVRRCKLNGVYQLVANGRGACSSSREYLVYYGGNKDLCARNITTTRAPGDFKGPRSHWRLDVTTGSGATTPVITAGRSCPAGENGMNGSDNPSKTDVFLAQKWHRWELRPVDSTCSNFNLIDASRTKRGAPAFLSMSANCGDKNPSLASKDTGSGRQRWTLRKVEARDAEIAARTLELEFAG